MLFVLAIALVPGLDDTYLAGVPVSWVLLGVGIYPLVITVGALYLRAAGAERGPLPLARRRTSEPGDRLHRDRRRWRS